MASGATGSARFIAINRLYATNLESARRGLDFGVVKTGTVPSVTMVETAATGDSAARLTSQVAHQTAKDTAHRTNKSAINGVSGATTIQRHRTAHG